LALAALAAVPASQGAVLRAPEREAAIQVIREHFPPGARLTFRWPEQRFDPGFCGWVAQDGRPHAAQFFVIGAWRGRKFVIQEAGVENGIGSMVSDICSDWGYPQASPN
jgi:hypothetical protein